MDFIVVGYGALDSAISADHLARRVGRYVGARHHTTCLLHAGQSADPISIGRISTFRDEQVQQADVKKFCEEIPHLMGGFGSWWGETFAHIERISVRYSAHRVRVDYLVERASHVPLGWDGPALTEWFAERYKKWGDIGDTFNVISRLPASACFADGPFVRQMKLEGWLDEGVEADGRSGAELVVNIAGQTETIRPHLLLQGTSEFSYVGKCIITLPTKLPTGSIDVATFDNVPVDKITFE